MYCCNVEIVCDVMFGVFECVELLFYEGLLVFEEVVDVVGGWCILGCWLEE